MLKLNKPTYRTKTAKEVKKARQHVKRQQNIERRDPALKEILDACKGLKPREVEERSGGLIGRSTFTAWVKGDTKCPQHYTMSGALKSVGKKFAIVNDTAKRS